MADALDEVLAALCDSRRTVPFTELPETVNHWYAVWIDGPGAEELSAVTVEPVLPGIVYVGECVKQSPRRHLWHNTPFT